MLKFKKIAELRERILISPHTFIIISDKDDTLIDKKDRLISPKETHQLLFDNVFAIATLRSKPLQESDEPIAPLFESGLSCREIITGAKVRENDWSNATVDLMRRDLTEFLSTVNLGLPLKELIGKSYEALKTKDLVSEEQILILIIETLLAEVRRRSAPDDCSRMLANAINLCAEGKHVNIDPIPQKIVNLGMNHLKPCLYNLVLANDDVATYEYFYKKLNGEGEDTSLIVKRPRLKDDLKNIAKLGTTHWNKSKLRIHIEEQLKAAHEEYFARFKSCIDYIRANPSRGHKGSQKLLQQEFKRMLGELQAQHKFPNEQATCEAVAEAAGYYGLELVDLQIAAGALGNDARAKANIKAHVKGSERVRPERDPEPVESLIKIVKEDRKHIIYVGKDTSPRHIKLTLSNLSDKHFDEILGHKLKQFLEICFQLGVIPDGELFDVKWEGGAEVSKIPAGRIIYMDDTQQPVTVASRLGFKAVQVITQPVAEGLKEDLGRLKGLITELEELAQAVIGSANEIKKNTSILAFCAGYTRYEKTIRELLDNRIPSDWRDIVIALNDTIRKFVEQIRINDAVKSEEDDLIIDNSAEFVGRITAFPGICNEMRELYSRIEKRVSEQQNFYPFEIMKHMEQVLRVRAPSAEGFDDARASLQPIQKAVSLFRKATVVPALSEHNERILRRLVLSNNFDALELLGDAFHRAKELRLARACYRLIYLAKPGTVIELSPIEEKILQVEKDIAQKAEKESKAEKYNDYLIVKFDSAEKVIRDQKDANGLYRLAGVYRCMAKAYSSIGDIINCHLYLNIAMIDIRSALDAEPGNHEIKARKLLISDELTSARPAAPAAAPAPAAAKV